MSSEGLRLLGRAHYGLAQVDQAIDAYHRALAVDERDVWSMNNLGLIYIEQGRSPEALPALARAVELRDNSPVFQNNLGTALEKSGYPLRGLEGVRSRHRGGQQLYQGLAQPGPGDHQWPGARGRASGSGDSFGQVPGRDRGLAWFDHSSGFGRRPDSSVVPDPSTGSIVGLSDSSRASVEAVTDTLEDCARRTQS